MKWNTVKEIIKYGKKRNRDPDEQVLLKMKHEDIKVTLHSVELIEDALDTF